MEDIGVGGGYTVEVGDLRPTRDLSNQKNSFTRTSGTLHFAWGTSISCARRFANDSGSSATNCAPVRSGFVSRVYRDSLG
jgi:hypothetical protein